LKDKILFYSCGGEGIILQSDPKHPEIISKDINEEFDEFKTV